MTITDTCGCGARFVVTAGATNANGYQNHEPKYQHDSWLDAHKVCREVVPPSQPKEPKL